MQPVNCAAGAVIPIGHMRAGTVDIAVHISVDFSVAFIKWIMYCGLAATPEMAREIPCQTLPAPPHALTTWDGLQSKRRGGGRTSYDGNIDRFRYPVPANNKGVTR